MRKIIPLTAFLPAAIFPVAAFVIGLRNPAIFEAPALIKNSPFPAILFLFAAAMLIFRQRSGKSNQNFDGLVLFLLFSLGYFLIAGILNKTGVNTNNIYFSADSGSWYLRMASIEGWDTGTRAIHPFSHLLFRPSITLLSMLTGGDRFHAALLLLAAVGGGCVFLMWKIVRLLTENPPYAVLCASLLGLSASHLIFSSILETYIFSTFFLLLFIWLVLENKSNALLIAAGTITFGITLTNIVQQGLTFLFVKRDIKRTALVFGLVLLFSVGLNLVSKFIYPVTDYFFIPQNLAGEERFSREVNLQRVGLVAENLFMYNIAAPQPYLSIRNEMPRFNFLNGSIQNYVWFGWAAVFGWGLVLLLLPAHLFHLSRSARDASLLTALAACLLFNFLLQLGYGVEPFLYSPGWTYALVLLAALAFRDTAKRIEALAGFLFLVTFIMLNNLWLLYLIARRAADYLV
jgi:hypothetical protein